LADTLARLEEGAGAVVTSSGMAAVDLVPSLLRPGDLVLALRYGRTILRGDEYYYRWCFPDLMTAHAFVEQFGGAYKLLTRDEREGLQPISPRCRS
jgi:cystathionine beta-lyase/cystathionine gamma-synthase